MPPVPNKEITPLKEDLSLHSNQKTPPMRGKSSNEFMDRKSTPREYKCYCNPDGSVVRIREEMKNTEGDSFQVHLSNLIGKNKDYFDHLGGRCVCGMCICGRCKCPKKNLIMDVTKSVPSEYKAKYVPLKPYDNGPALKGDFYTSNNFHTPLDFSTTNRNDYKPPKLPPQSAQANRDNNQFSPAPFLGTSSYKNDYVNWLVNPTGNLKPGYQGTVIKDLPFVGRTIYRDNYQGIPTDRNNSKFNSSKFGTFRSPMNPDFPFIGDTTYKTNYKPFKTYKYGEDSAKPKNDFEKGPVYDGLFLSTTGKDFSDKGLRKCPAREVLNKMANEGVISWTGSHH